LIFSYFSRAVFSNHVNQAPHFSFVLLLFLPAPGETDDLSTMRISMMISAQYQTITLIVEMTIQDLTKSVLGNPQAK